MIMRKIGSVVVLGIVGLAWSAQGALVVPVSQTLHCEAHTGDGEHRLVDAPADVVLGAVYGTQTVSARSEQEGYGGYEGWGGHLLAGVSLTTQVQGNAITAAGSAHTSPGMASVNEWKVGCGAKSHITFDIDVASVFEINFTDSRFCPTDVEIRSGEGVRLWCGWLSGYNSEQALLTLPAGHYELDLSVAGTTVAGNGGSGEMSFSMVAVPEPTGLSAWALGVLVLRRRR